MGAVYNGQYGLLKKFTTKEEAARQQKQGRFNNLLFCVRIGN
jgi:hypothetical protein